MIASFCYLADNKTLDKEQNIIFIIQSLSIEGNMNLKSELFQPLGW